jgi:hypothetical protein
MANLDRNDKMKSTAETDILNLSLEKFKRKTTRQYDKISDLFDDDLVIIHISVHTTTKKSGLIS